MKKPTKKTTTPKGYSALIYPKVLKEFQRMSDRSRIPLVRLINWCLDEYGSNIDIRLGGMRLTTRRPFLRPC